MPESLPFDGGLSCALSVTNLDKAIAWYTEVLGFELVYRMDEMGWCELNTPIPRVTVGLSQVEQVEGKGGATLTWGVSDIAAARKLLEARDVRFDGDIITVPEMVKFATFFDPDGNTLMFYQDISEQG